jgi:site-specific recombinase XerD
VNGNPEASAFVFPRQQDRVWFERALTAAKITDYSWHTNRHTFCSRMAMLGIPLFTIAEIAGHRDIKVTRRYAHLPASHNLDAVEKLVSKPTPKVAPAATA